jgi:ribosome biogenesis GTPase / thiamine phosphate phosphatase
MSKRKLSRRQAWRVQKIQEERTQRANKRAEVIDQQLNEGELGNEQSGLVIANYGSQVDVECQNGEEEGLISRCHLRANLETPVTGDQVIWRSGDPTGVVVAVEARKSELTRPDIQGKQRTIAANIDYIVIVLAPIPEPHYQLIDRYLIAAESVSIKPLILLNKFDLVTDENRLKLKELLAIYPQLGYQVLEASTKTQNGLDALEIILKDRVSVFVGQSGVGKSSLIKSLLPGVDVKIGELSEKNAEGMHTTTTAKLFHFPRGGDLIDSPGVREFGLWHMQREQILDGFVEFRPYLGRCKFRNCLHDNEPGCELQEAVIRGDISKDRVKSFELIAKSLETMQR